MTLVTSMPVDINGMDLLVKGHSSYKQHKKNHYKPLSCHFLLPVLQVTNLSSPRGMVTKLS